MNQNLNILQLINRFPWPLKDGGAVGYYNWLCGYSQAGCNVTAAILNTTKHYINFNNIPQEVKNLANYHLVEIDNRIKPANALLNLFTRKSYHVQRFESNTFHRLLTELLTTQHFDVVVFESIFMAMYLPTVKKYSNATCVVRAHNVEYKIWETQSNIARNPIKKWYLNIQSKRLKKFELSVLQQFDGIVPITQKDATLFLQHGITKPMHIAPAGINLNRFLQFEPNHSLAFFHLGSMDWMPNQEAMMWFIKTVWPDIIEKHPNLTFTVAGRNMPEKFFKLQCKGVKIIGEVENADAFMQQYGIMIVPLYSGSGMRIKILEGMAMGKCIISTPLGAEGILAQPDKEIFLARNKSDFVKIMLNLIKNPELIKQTGLAARKAAVNNYSNHKVVEQTLMFYKRLLNIHE